jgi:hypothetical protein
VLRHVSQPGAATWRMTSASKTRAAG